MPDERIQAQRRAVRNRTPMGGPGGPMPVGGLISGNINPPLPPPGPLPTDRVPGGTPGPMPPVDPNARVTKPYAGPSPINPPGGGFIGGLPQLPPAFLGGGGFRDPTARTPPDAMLPPMNPPMGGGGMMDRAARGAMGLGGMLGPNVRQKPMQERNIIRNVGGRGLGPY